MFHLFTCLYTKFATRQKQQAHPITLSYNTRIAKSFSRLLGGLFFSSGIGLLAYRRRSLSRSGVAGAIITGTTTVGMGGWAWGLALIFFFLSSSLLSHFKEQEKASTATDKFSKGSQRDIAQVAANGGMATLLAFAHGLTTSERTRALLQAGYVGTLATATADTWATELGVLSTQPPRLITTGQITTPGTSGGITPLGIGAAVLGSSALGSVFWLLQGARREQNALPLLALAAGTAGSLADSLLGATVQAMYYCPTCKKETEQRVHRCGTRTRFLRGQAWIDNDVVNFATTLFGALVAISLSLPFLRAKQRHTNNNAI